MHSQPLETDHSVASSNKVVVTTFGGVENLQVVEESPKVLQPNEVAIALKSVGMNQADLMARRGEYRLSSGEPPFTPGIEGGGVIVEVGSQVTDRQIGQRVILSLGAAAGNGTYRTRFVTTAQNTLQVPDTIDERLLGALWLPFVTAWGALVGRQNIQSGQIVLLPAASSSVAIAASQIVKQYGGITIGTTTSPEKIDALKKLPAAKYDHIVLTTDSAGSIPWWKTIKRLTQGHGVDIVFDPVAAGEFLHHEIRLLAQGATLWVYGLLGTPGTLDVSPLIRKDAAIRGWLLNHITNTPAEQVAYTHILDNVATGNYQMPIAGAFMLEQVQTAHAEMEKGNHIGKYILTPCT